MNTYSNLRLTALAPIIWGTTYITTTEFLPDGLPVTLAMMRALPAGLLLLIIVRELPKKDWWWKAACLGALNFTIFWTLLFLAAYRLPGGVAAMLGSVQPLIVISLSYIILNNSVDKHKISAALIGIVGVLFLVMKSTAALDFIGIGAGLGSALSMAMGVVLTKKWSRNAPALLTLTAWQLTAGGVLLIPLAYFLEPSLPMLTGTNYAALLWLSLFGAAISYIIWFRGISKADVAMVSILGFLSPLTAIIIDWLYLHQPLNMPQVIGVMFVVLSLIVNQKALIYKKGVK